MEDKVTVGAVITVFVLFFACGFFFGLFAKSIGTLDSKIGRQTTHGIVYSISIDSTITDSLYGKTWRKENK
jgi:hypothetical protein